MMIDTHCHINMMIKDTFDTLLTQENLQKAKIIINEAILKDVTKIINIGTSFVESKNSIILAQEFSQVYAAVGIHPTDCTEQWEQELSELEQEIQNNKKIVGIGECGIDLYHPGYNLDRQIKAFKKQIECALKYNRALVVHTRNAGKQTLACLEEFRGSPLRGVIHCFSEDAHFAQQALSLGFALGIGGIITYPKNNYLREIVQNIGLEHIVLETDAPFLPPQIIRGKKNSPQQIATIAQYIAELLGTDIHQVGNMTTQNAQRIFNLD